MGWRCVAAASNSSGRAPKPRHAAVQLLWSCRAASTWPAYPPSGSTGEMKVGNAMASQSRKISCATLLRRSIPITLTPHIACWEGTASRSWCCAARVLGDWGDLFDSCQVRYRENTAGMAGVSRRAWAGRDRLGGATGRAWRDTQAMPAVFTGYLTLQLSDNLPNLQGHVRHDTGFERRSLPSRLCEVPR